MLATGETSVEGIRDNSELLRRVASGDRPALRLILTELRPQLRESLSSRIPAWLQRLVDADDIIQTAYVDVFRRIDSEFGPRDPRSFPRWVTAIALNRARDAIRQEKAAKRGGGRNGRAYSRKIEDSTISLLNQIAGSGESPSRSVSRREVVSAVQQAIETLPTRYQQVIWTVYIQGRSVKDAAVAMDRSERAVHGLCRRGLKLLEVQLRRRTGLLTSTG